MTDVLRHVLGQIKALDKLFPGFVTVLMEKLNKC